MSQSCLPYLRIQFMQLGNCEVSTSHKKKRREKKEKSSLLQFSSLGVGMTTVSKQSSQALTESKKLKETVRKPGIQRTARKKIIKCGDHRDSERWALSQTSQLCPCIAVGRVSYS